MSLDITDPNVQSAPEAQQGQADGSPPASGSTPTSENVEDAGSGNTEGVAEPQAPANEMKALRQKLTEQGEQIAGFMDLFNHLKRDPELWTRIEDTVNGRREPVDPTAAVLSEVDSIFDADAAPALKAILSKYEKALEQKFMGKLSPVLRDVVAQTQDAKVASGFRKAGLDPSLAQSEEYQEFRREDLLQRPWLKAVERADPVAAAELHAKAYAEQAGLKRQIHNEASRIGAVKAAAALESRGGKAGPTAAAVNRKKIARNNGSLHAIFEQLKAGVDPAAIDLE